MRSRRTSRSRRAIVVVVVAAVLASLVVAALPRRADAFKPYTHAQGGAEVLADVADGTVEINGQTYAPDEGVVSALIDWPCFYNAGVIGPDGFPTLLMGQSIIHSENTGQWLDLILREAWSAQDDARYSAQEKSQILAFSYGYLTHAAGDMWMHNLVNEFALGVFPSVGDVVTTDRRLIALRHLLIEGYVGDATPGYDGDPAYGDVVFAGAPIDFSGDASPSICFDAPIDFIYDVLVDRATPIPDLATGEPGSRGVLIDLFWDLHDGLLAIAEREGFEATLDAAAEAVDDAEQELADAQDALDDFLAACSFEEFDLAECIDAAGDLWDAGFDAALTFFEGAVSTAEAALGDATAALLGTYFEEWAQDIEDGLEAWPELGLALTNAMFDPQFRRDVENDECGHLVQPSIQREACETAITKEQVFLAALDPFINDHLLSMIGLPDAVGDTRAALLEIADAVGDAIDELGSPVINVLAANDAQIAEFNEGLVLGALDLVFGFDLLAVEDFLDSPSSKLDLTGVYDLPGFSDPVQLFEEDDHAQVDALLGIEGEHHRDPVELHGFFDGIEVPGGLEDDVVFDRDGFAAFANKVQMAKLLLLGPRELDRVVDDVLTNASILRPDVEVALYRGLESDPESPEPDPTVNIMTTALLDPDGDPQPPWLVSIDGDHAWRANRLPAFEGPDFDDQPFAGTGQMPMWESCLGREAFRRLFDDWENGDATFPDLDDEPSPYPGDAPPTNTLEASLNFYEGDDGVLYLGPNHVLTHRATDDTFLFSAIDLSRSPEERVGDATASAFQVVGADGIFDLSLTATDPCETTTDTYEVGLDTTGPVIDTGGPYTVAEGSAVVLDGTATTDALSGVASTAWTSTDTSLFTQGSDPVTFIPADDDDPTVTLTAIDNLGNASSTDVTVTVTNVAPTVDAGPNQVVAEGTTLSLAPATFNDPGTLDTHTATIDWGDGTAVEAGTVTESPSGPPGSLAGLDGTVAGSHVYADNGSYTVTVCVTDDDGAQHCDTLAATVTNADPTVQIDAIGDGPDFFLPLVDVSLSGSFNDPGTLDTHTAEIDWGDGTAVVAGTVTESPFGPPGSLAGLDGTVAFAPHAYSTAGTYTVEVEVADKDLGEGSASTAVEVVSPAEALMRLDDDLSSLLADPDLGDDAADAIAEALKDLAGPTAGGPPNSGALDKLADEDYNATLTKIVDALGWLADAEASGADVALAELILTQVAASIAADLVAQAETFVGPSPSRGDARQLDRMNDAYADGIVAMAAGRWVVAAEMFDDAVARAVNLLS